jgi:hypothetical protein
MSDKIDLDKITIEVALKDTTLFTDICQLMKKFYDDIRLPVEIKQEFEIDLKKIISKY